MILVRGLLIPLQGLLIILRHTLAQFIAEPQIVLSNGKALFGCLTQP